MPRVRFCKLALSGAVAGLFLLCACSSQLETVTSTVTNTTLLTRTTTLTVISVVPSTPVTLLYPVPAVSEDQAFAIAKQYVPASVLYAPNIVTVLSISQPKSHGFWSTFFDGLNITKQELIDFGWREDATTSFGETESYSQIQIRIDAQTGEVVSKIAWNGIKLGGKPLVTTDTSN